jgi:hypothetical protein
MGSRSSVHYQTDCLCAMCSKIEANLWSIKQTLASVSRSAIQRASRTNTNIASISGALYIDNCLGETKAPAEYIDDNWMSRT